MVYHEGQGYRAQAQAMPGVPGCTAIEARTETVGTLHWQWSRVSVTAAILRRRPPTCFPRVLASGPTSLDDLTLLNFPRASTVNRPDPCCCSSFFFLTNNSTHIVNCRYQTSMPGYILGTGGGVAAAAAVYYTLSTNMDHSTARVRSE